jgi:hypothetical protein
MYSIRLSPGISRARPIVVKGLVSARIGARIAFDRLGFLRMGMARLSNPTVSITSVSPSQWPTEWPYQVGVGIDRVTPSVHENLAVAVDVSCVEDEIVSRRLDETPWIRGARGMPNRRQLASDRLCEPFFEDFFRPRLHG